MAFKLNQSTKAKIPNMITNARLVFLPVLIFFIIFPLPQLGVTFLFGYYFPTQIVVAFWLFVILALTDFVDGYLARKWDAVSTYGKFMDPILDKILVLSTLIALVAINLAPAWIVIVILVRETLVSGIRLLMAEQNIVVSASWSGKLKTATTMAWICLLFLGNFPFEIINLPVTDVLGIFVAIITIYSGLEYYIDYRKSLGE